MRRAQHRTGKGHLLAVLAQPLRQAAQRGHRCRRAPAVQQRAHLRARRGDMLQTHPVCESTLRKPRTGAPPDL